MDVNLVMFKTNGQLKAIPITKSKTVLGRGAECDIRIPIESCSRKQCQLTIEGKEVLRLKDLGSSNGTYVNNVRVEETVLNPGDKLIIGPITMTVQINGMPVDIKESPSAMANMDDVGGDLIPSDDQSTDPLMDLAGSSDAGGEDQTDPLAELAASGDVGEDDPLAALESLADQQDEEE
jgi:pSer/pThr/pTyr-binding forkhead associated (FHA) protein